MPEIFPWVSFAESYSSLSLLSFWMDSRTIGQFLEAPVLPSGIILTPQPFFWHGKIQAVLERENSKMKNKLTN
jgi:hypothetical protein